jgi:hypothetical protein
MAASIRLRVGLGGTRDDGSSASGGGEGSRVLACDIDFVSRMPLYGFVESDNVCGTNDIWYGDSSASGVNMSPFRFYIGWKSNVSERSNTGDSRIYLELPS